MALVTSFNQSQSSVSSMAADGRSSEICSMCKTKPSAVSLTACGHDTFCFKCISGVEKCPLCSKEVAGWVPLQQKLSVRPLLVSPPAAAVEDREDLEDSDDEVGAGLVHWCNDDVFSEGGVRTMVGNDANKKKRLDLSEELPKKERPQEERPVDEAAKNPDRIELPALELEKTFSRRVVRTMAEVEPVIADLATQSAKPTAALCKKQGRLSIDIETLNHTRLMERPLTEILAEKLVSTTRGKRSEAASTCVGKKLRTGTTRANQCRLTVPAKFRD
ncbi:hypothetical protein KC19_VG288300 [Ceratodon purpureus]|uniref:RING-type domain-containing protein n=1 Tax=Ceratodon purpureus TaxID=3225 RepID=A0A8T0HVE0_CERPU|nr:hypothetical protein KC19_VG288300 [Ceratodon purpureus]